MADETITGKLVVTEKIGIGIEEPIAQLHISSVDPNRVFIESGGSLLKLSVDGTSAAIGTEAGTGVPLVLQTDGTNRLTITSSGITTFMGPLIAQNTLTINGSVGIGTAASPTAKLQVSGVIAATSFQGDASGLTGLQIPSGSIGNIQLADNAVTAAKIQDGSVGQAELAVNSVIEAKIASNAVTTSKIAPGAVVADRLADGAVTNPRLGQGSVTEQKLADNAVTTLKIAPLAITNEKLANHAVTNEKLADGAITLNKLDASARPAASQWVGNEGGGIAYTGGNVGIGTATPGAPLHVSTYMTVGPFSATTGVGGIDVTGPVAEFGFLKRSLTAWSASPAAGDRFAWYNPDGTARLYTEQRGDLLTVTSNGFLGLNTTAPIFGLDVRGSNGWIGSGDSSQTVGGWRLGKWPTYATANTWVYLSRADSANYQDLAIGTLWAGGATRFGTADDLAEMTPTKAGDELEPGDVVVLAEPPDARVLLKKSYQPYDRNVAGVISDPATAGLMIGGSQPTDCDRPDLKPLALAGRVLTKVSTENGPIQVGDLLVTASQAGYAMKATQAGYVLGKAMQSFSGENGVSTGKIWILVNLSWYGCIESLPGRES